jgi:hypothetical protein
MDIEAPACRLCRQRRPLCRSHIVPELAYQPIKNDKHQMFLLEGRVKTKQTGHWERLLCSDCETLLSGYETEFKKSWMDTIPRSFGHLRTRPLEDAIVVGVPDYGAFKLFHLSVFWRASVSQSFKVGGGIWLGEYEDQVGSLLRSGDPGDPGDFPIYAYLSLDTATQPVPTVSSLVEGQCRFEGIDHRVLMMSYAFCDWMLMPARPGPHWLAEFEVACRRENTFTLLTVPHRHSKSLQLAAQVHESGRSGNR